MIRFVDLRYQGVQNRFAFWDTTTDLFREFDDSQAWETWDEFETDVTAASPPALEPALKRYRALCPAWVFEPATDEELEFADETTDPGVLVERSRARRELLALITGHAGDQVSINRLRFWVDAVCPADGKES